MAGEPGILPHQEILRLCNYAAGDTATGETTTGIVRPCLRANVRSASYDLRVGLKYYLGEANPDGVVEISELEPGRNEVIEIPRNGVVIITTLEDLELPDDIVGNLSLKLDLLLNGLIMASQSQIDAGYNGRIFALLYNLSTAPVSLRYGDSFLRLELARLAEASTRPYDGKYSDTELSAVLRKRVDSSLSSMYEQLDSSDRKLTRTQWVATIAGLLLVAFPAAFTAGLSFIGPISDVKERVSHLEGEIGGSAPSKADLVNEKQDARLAAQQKQIATLKAEVKRLQKLVRP